MEKVNDILKKYWNIDSLKEKQHELISHYLSGNDVVGLLPTGYGKSMCYLIPPLVTDKVIFIISPLISLMEDQKEKLINMNIPVATLHGNNLKKDSEIFKIIDGEINIVYMSPEYLIRGEGFELANTLMETDRLGYFAIDESHCISLWGHDFRSDYMKLYKFRKRYPTIPIMAVTATATKQVVDDIIMNMKMVNPKLIIANFDRPNIYLKCIGVKKISVDNIIPWLNKYSDAKIIIYSNNRADTVELSKEINNLKIDGIMAAAYHAGMTKGLRYKIQTKFNNNMINVIVSTVAFGIGIDQTVRCVIIFGSPNSIEEYYQMIGRAGRDGKAAESILLFQYKNIAIGTSMIRKSDMDKEIIENKVLNRMANYFYTDSCRRRFILEYFGQVPKFFWCNYCDNCCEEKNINLTDKFKEIIFNKKKIEDILTQKELNIAKASNIITDKNGYYELLNTIKNWKKQIEMNKYLEKGIPKKYMIMCKEKIRKKEF